MILEYNYDKGNIVLEHFKKSELATLEIKTVKENDETKFVMEYTYVEDYPEQKQKLIRTALSNSLSQRLSLCNIINQFIENEILNNVKDFNLKFNAVNTHKCEISYSSSFLSTFKNVNQILEMTKCLEKLEDIMLKMGIHDQPTKNIYKKVGNGRNKKYSALTIQDIVSTLRHSLLEE